MSMIEKVDRAIAWEDLTPKSKADAMENGDEIEERLKCECGEKKARLLFGHLVDEA
jgi:hypothetical protein